MSSDQQLSDEEIDYVIAERGNTISSAIAACDHIIARYARLVTQSAGGISVQYSNRIKQYQDLQARLKLRIPVAMYSGGLSQNDKNANNADPDRVQPSFSRGQFDRRW